MSTIKSDPYIKPQDNYLKQLRANDTQVGGTHYKVLDPRAQEHWDIVRFHKLDYFQAAITKYVMRHKNKNGLQDLKKARHFLDKYIEIIEEVEHQEMGVPPTPGYVNQDR